jgi:pimeloyl-ACP methyl ester carboxylesterase
MNGEQGNRGKFGPAYFDGLSNQLLMNSLFVKSLVWMRAGTVAMLAIGWFTGAAVFGQEKKEEDEKKPIAPENIALETKDGVSIKATYYASKLKKKAIPIIMLHGWEGNRSDFHILAALLQNQGYAVICPDLRGHGQSLKYKLPGGGAEEFELEKMKGPDLDKMVLDVEACKKFLLEKNNAGELNIEALCVVGSQLGCSIAMMWSAMDWNARSLPAFKQGQDVKAMILLSPVETFRGVTIRGPMGHPIVSGKTTMGTSRFNTLICVGKEDAKAHADAKKMYTALLKFHGKPPAKEEDAAKSQDLFFLEEETSLQGTDLIRNGLQTPAYIQKFLYLRLSLKLDEYEWTDRKEP